MLTLRMTKADMCLPCSPSLACWTWNFISQHWYFTISHSFSPSVHINYFLPQFFIWHWTVCNHIPILWPKIWDTYIPWQCISQSTLQQMHSLTDGRLSSCARHISSWVSIPFPFSDGEGTRVDCTWGLPLDKAACFYSIFTSSPSLCYFQADLRFEYTVERWA